jgi:hypothetical protein
MQSRSTVLRSEATPNYLLRGLASCVVITFLAVACQQEPLASGGEGESPITRPRMTIGSCDDSEISGDQFTPYWNCNDNISIGQSGTGPDLSFEIGGAAAAWNLGHGLPTFSYTSDGGVFSVVRHGTGTYYCGSTDDGATNPINIYPSTHTECGGRRIGTAARVLLHEMGHKIGLQSWYHSAAQEGYSDHCSMALPLDVNDHLSAVALCATEMEEVLYRYHVRGDVPDWGNHFIDGAMIDIGTQLMLGASDTAQVTHLIVGKNPGLSLCPEPWGEDDFRCVAVGSATFSWGWTGAPSGAVSLSGTGSTSTTVTGVTAGGVIVSATLTGSGGYQTTTPFESASFVSVATTGVVSPVLSMISGSGQTGVKGLALLDSLVVRLMYDGSPAAGQSITLAVTSGGGSLSSTSVTTDVNGYARSRWTLGGTAGSNGASASRTGATGSPVNFTATGATMAAPTAFSWHHCNIEVLAGDTLIDHEFRWTAAALPAWEIGMKATNDTTGLSVVLSNGSGVVTTYGPFVKGANPKGNRYFFIRASYGSTKSSWVASSTNPINVTGSTAGCIL